MHGHPHQAKHRSIPSRSFFGANRGDATCFRSVEYGLRRRHRYRASGRTPRTPEASFVRPRSQAAVSRRSTWLSGDADNGLPVHVRSATAGRPCAAYYAVDQPAYLTIASLARAIVYHRMACASRARAGRPHHPVGRIPVAPLRGFPFVESGAQQSREDRRRVGVAQPSCRVARCHRRCRWKRGRRFAAGTRCRREQDPPSFQWWRHRISSRTCFGSKATSIRKSGALCKSGFSRDLSFEPCREIGASNIAFGTTSWTASPRILNTACYDLPYSRTGDAIRHSVLTPRRQVGTEHPGYRYPPFAPQHLPPWRGKSCR